MRSPVVLSAVAALMLGIPSGPSERQADRAAAAPPSGIDGCRALQQLQVAFVPNLGQWHDDVRYVARAGATTMFLERGGWTCTLAERGHTGSRAARSASRPAPEQAAGRGVAVRMAFGGSGCAQLVAEQPLPGRNHYYLGNDPAKWRSDVPQYGSICWRGVQPGVDVRMREVERRFEYDVLLAPGADLAAVEIEVSGIEAMQLDDEGALVLATALGPLRMQVPCTWETDRAGAQTPVDCRYELRGPRRFGFAAPGWRTDRALVIDPGIEWSTLLGGSSDDWVVSIATAADGAPIVTGSTLSTNFPSTAGPYVLGAGEAFLVRLTPDGSSLVYAVVFGGSGFEFPDGLALDGQGGAVVAGTTQSFNFPITSGVFGPNYHPTGIVGAGDGFVARFTPTGTLLYGSFLGGNNFDYALGVAVDAAGVATVVGETYSPDFPVTPNALIATPQGYGDGFVVQVAPDGSALLFGTFLGGAERDQAWAVAVDATGAITVTGNTSSLAFPTTPGAFDPTYNGGGYNGWGDVFVTQILPSVPLVVFSTYLGDAGIEVVNAIAVDAYGVTLAGRTNSPRFPTTTGAFDTTYNGGSVPPRGEGDGFVTRLAPGGASLVYSTFLGGNGDDEPWALAVGPRGEATVAGWTRSAVFPTTAGALAAGSAGLMDVFVTRLAPSGSRLEYSTYLGGSGDDSVLAMTMDPRGGVVVAGGTGSANYPTTAGAFQPAPAGGGEGCVTRLDLLPTGVSAFGSSTPGCTGPLAIGVTSMPRVGNPSFAFTCGGAAPNAFGMLAIGGGRLPAALPVLGVGIWLDPALLLATATVGSNPNGACELPLPIGNNPALAGLRLFAQFLWLGPSSPAPCPPLGLSASNALDLVVQP